MIMKEHILAGLREEFQQWEEFLARLDETQTTAPLSPSPLSVKDEIAHLWAWQQRTAARVEAALRGGEPQFPAWLPDADPEDIDITDPINAWIFNAYRQRPWAQVYADWRAGFLHLLEAAQEIPERDLLDAAKYPWLEGYPLALVLLGTYDHHQEHLEKLAARLGEHGIIAANG